MLGGGFWLEGMAETQAQVLNALAAQSFWLLLAGGAVFRAGPLHRNLGLLRGRFGAAALLVSVAGFVCFAYGLQLFLLAAGLRHEGRLAELDLLIRNTAAAAPWLAWFAFCAAPGFCEELLFRGFLQRALGDVFRPAAAVFLAALLFGLAHWDVVHSPAAFLLGLYFGALAWLAGSLWPAVLCHLANNALAVWAALYAAPAPAPPAGAPALAAACVLAAAGLALLGLLFWREKFSSAARA